MIFKPTKIAIAVLSGLVFIACAAFIYFKPDSVYAPEAKEAEKLAEDFLKEDLRD